MGELMPGLDFARAYIDELLVLSNNTFEGHLEKVEVVPTWLLEAGLKVNISKSDLARAELENLGYWITRDGIKPLNKKVEAINNLATPKTRKELRRFIGIVNYYRDMWPRRYEILAPITKMTSKQSSLNGRKSTKRPFKTWRNS